MTRLVNLWLRNYRLGLFLAFLVTLPAAYFSAKLYGNVKPDLEELLPRQSRAILDLDEIRGRLLSVQKIFVLIESKDASAAKRFQTDIARRLAALPPTEVADVEYRIDRELKFFSDRKSLFLELSDLSEIRDYISKRIEYEKELYNPLNIFSEIEIPEPRYDFRTLDSKYQGQATRYTQYPEGYYATPDGTKRLVTVYMPGTRVGVKGVYAFQKQIVENVAALNPGSYAPDLQVRFAGPAQDVIEEHSALMDDIETSAQLVFSVVLVVIMFFFRSVLATAALLLALFTARFWTFGISWFLVGSLNANSAFMGSIVLGSGITYGVMLLARYMEERRKGRGPLRSVYVAIHHTTRATWTAAICAGFAYASLYLTEFEGFRQYGIMGLIGMVLCWLSSVFVLPALLLLIEGYRSLAPRHRAARRQFIFGPLTRSLGRRPGWYLVGSIAMTVLAALSLTRFDADRILERDLSKLRNRTSMREGSGFLAHKVNEILRAPNAPVVVLAHSREYAREISKRLKAQKDSEGQDSLILAVADLDNFIPASQAEKIAVIEEIREILHPRLRRRLATTDRAKAEQLLDSSSLDPITLENLPGLVKNKFTEKNGSIGNLVLVDPRMDSMRWSGQQLTHFVSSVRRAADEVEGRPVPVAGNITVTADMIASIIRDGPKATFFAFLFVVLLVVLIFRHLPTAGLMLGSLLIGVFWMVGVILWFDLKINFLNFIALPITFGIGVDYGVNVFDRYLREPGVDLLEVVRETGGAVGLCSFTTIVGYYSLVIAQNQAFVSFGTIAIIGEVMTMLGAVIALPSAVLWWQGRRNETPASTLAAAEN